MKAVLVSVVVLVSALSLAPSSSRAAGAVTGTVGGSAYALHVIMPAGSAQAGTGELFLATFAPCTFAPGGKQSSAASMSAGNYASSGTIYDAVTAATTATTVSVRASSTIQNLRVLGGLISATAVQAVANSTANASSASSSNGSTLTNVVVGGQQISATVAPNTKISLRGIGYVVLNEQSGPTNGTNKTSIGVNAIDVYVTMANSLGLPIGARIIAGHADSSFSRTAYPGSVAASAYALFVSGGAGTTQIHSGPYAFASIPCTGGSKTNSLAGASVPNVGTTGTMKDTASGSLSGSGATASATSTLSTVSLLQNVIHASTVRAIAHASWTGSGAVGGSTYLATAAVAGTPVSAYPAPNTRMNLAGIGYVVLNEQSPSTTASGASMTVNAIDVYVTMSNALGLPIGTRIIVGHAMASATPAT